jgi:cell division protein FtsN
MDVGYFISELLAQDGNVSVPGLGNFAYNRINGYYNEQDGKLYPPAYRVAFNQQFTDDEKLTLYIADKKNISLASSKYFTDKFITNLKLQAQTEEVQLADLGWFYTDSAKLLFKPTTDQGPYPDFFGYEPLAIKKLPVANIVTSTVAIPDTTVEIPALPQQMEIVPAATQEHEYVEEEVIESKKRTGWVIFAVAAVALLAVTFFAINLYNPSIFRSETVKDSTANKTVKTVKVAPVKDTVAKDTVKQNVIKDSVKAVSTPPVKDAVTTPPAINNIITGRRFELMGGSFNSLKEANTAIRNYKHLGIDAHIVTDLPGRRIKVSIGTFKNRSEVAKARKELLLTKKVSKDIYPLEIKPKL